MQSFAYWLSIFLQVVKKHLLTVNKVPHSLIAYRILSLHMKAATQIYHLQTQHLSAKKRRKGSMFVNQLLFALCGWIMWCKEHILPAPKKNERAHYFNLIFSYSNEKNIRKVGCNVVLKIWTSSPRITCKYFNEGSTNKTNVNARLCWYQSVSDFEIQEKTTD